MTKELLTIEFRYRYIPFSGAKSRYKNKEITIGIFDTLEEAVEEGNKILKILSKDFEVREKDCFSLNEGPFGSPVKLVSNCLYPTKGIKYFAEIKKQKFYDFSETLNSILEEAIERH